MKAARESPAVLKLALAELRSSMPDVPIFAFEGVDDKLIYYQWIGRLRPHLRYEPLVCRGKTGVLALRSAVMRDVNGLERGVYFFVDRDFDDLRGHDPSQATFMTDQYSVENYLVTRTVVEETLKNEFHCEGQGQLRSDLSDKFEFLYEEFLNSTCEINRRIYLGRRAGRNFTKHFPEKISKIICFSMEGITPAGSAEEIIQFTPDVSEQDCMRLFAEFDQLEPRTRYRGKFAFLFLVRWLEALVDEYNIRPAGVFGSVEGNSKVRSSEFTIGGFASKALPPPGLSEFINTVQ